MSAAEVLRDLHRRSDQPEQSYSERQLYEAALDRLAREFAAVEKIEHEPAEQRIEDVVLADVDAKTGSVELKVTAGVLRVGSISSDTVTLSGSIEEINARLAGGGRFYDDDGSYSEGLRSDTTGLTHVSGDDRANHISTDEIIYKKGPAGLSLIHI